MSSPDAPPTEALPQGPAAIRALRPPKQPFDPRRPLAVLVEEERCPGGHLEPALTLFLGGAECPFSCVFCDLWRHTLDRPTAPGDLPAQVRAALDELPDEVPGTLRRGTLRRGTLRHDIRRLKLYNASNFFDPRAVPPADLSALAELAAPFSRVVVECHPRLVGEACFAWARELTGTLEVALGLEVAHTETLRRLGKGMDLEDFDRAAGALAARRIAVRAFVLVGAPFLAAGEAVEWAVRSVAHAMEQGAEQVALIPVRGGNGALEHLAARGHFHPPRLDRLELALDLALELPAAASGRAVVSADLWDLERFSSCPLCFPERRARLERSNQTGCRETRVPCSACGGSP